MLNATITLEGKTYNDLVLATEEVLRHLENEYRLGHDSNDSGNYFLQRNGRGSS